MSAATLFATLQPGAGPRLMLAGHIDEIGVMVTYVDEEGYLSFDTIGGWDHQVFVGQRVQLLGRAGAVPGVIARLVGQRLGERDELPQPRVTGDFAPPSGTGVLYDFNGDGTCAYSAMLQSTVYSCMSWIFVATDECTWSFDGAVVTIEHVAGVTRSRMCGGEVKEGGMEPNTHFSYGPNEGRHFFSHAGERLRILGEIPVRKTDSLGRPVLDLEGNPDTSFLARIPADTPLHLTDTRPARAGSQHGADLAPGATG